jgi:gamma-glutamylcyclotransferase (GGCT)/AIG2-like uncharacterized protein YtfP
VERLFVYGTLRRTGTARHLLREGTFLGEASVRGTVLQQNGFPGLIPGDTSVLGEVFEIPDELFGRLDEYEGPGYERRQTEIDFLGEKLHVWVYWLV